MKINMDADKKSTLFISLALLLISCVLLLFPHILFGNSIESQIVTYSLALIILFFSIKDSIAVCFLEK